MKRIDVKSALIGILGTALVFVIMGSSFQDGDNSESNLEVDPYMNGIFVYDENTRLLYQYDVAFGSSSLSSTPKRTYTLAPDGSSLAQAE